MTEIRPMTPIERLASMYREMPSEARKAMLEKRIEELRKEWQQLSNENQGVRPSWVSGDLSSIETRLLFLRSELESMNDD